MSRQVYENTLFRRWFDHDSDKHISDIEFHRCTFDGCALSTKEDPAFRSVFRRVKVINCVVGYVNAGSAIVEDCLIDGLKTHKLLQTWGMVFKHVTLRGKIGRIMSSLSLIPVSPTPPSIVRAFTEANLAYYSGIDWALDISQAEFKECSIRSIPARLIRRDPETQAVVTREKAEEGTWKELDLDGTHWQITIEFMLDRPEDNDVVLVASKRARNFKALLAGIELLREAGVAEPD